MTTFLSYYVLLVLWLALIWPLFRLTGLARLWIGIVAAIGALAAGYELWVTFMTRGSAIRVDILLIAPVLSLLYASAFLTLFAGQWRKAAGILMLAVAAVTGGFFYGLISSHWESDRISELNQERSKLLFQAKFRDRKTYDTYFGMAGTRPVSHPVGHWATTGKTRFTRLIINQDGRTWLFYRCGDTECHYGPEGLGMRRFAEPPDTWKAALEKGISLEVTQDSPDRLSARIGTHAAHFVKAPPPVRAAPETESLTYLGAFSAFECTKRRNVWVRQVWLWRQNGRLHAVGIFARRLAGRRSPNLRPVVLGEGRRLDGGWAFDWQDDGRSWTARISLTVDGVSLVLARGGDDAISLVLAPGATVRDGEIGLASRTSAEDWRHWVDTVLVSHYSEADIPDC